MDAQESSSEGVETVTQVEDRPGESSRPRAGPLWGGYGQGSYDTNRTAAGVCSSSGIRSLAVSWSSTLTPSQTFDRNHSVSPRRPMSSNPLAASSA